MTQEQQNHKSNDSNYRYPGSRPFSDSDLDRRLFFGREKEIQYLFHSILVENLFILFAKSGMGKTSLLNAGVLELLRQKDFVPLVIRFNDPKKPPLDEIYVRIEEAVKQRNKKVAKQNKIDYEPGEKETLWQFFKTASFWSADDKSLTPVIILDQFEEFFNLHSLEEREKFTAQLADLVRNQIPKTLRDDFKANSNQRFPYSETAPQVKIIISIREDYLGNMEEMTRAIPGILKNRFRLLPLKSEQAKDAIIKPAGLSKDMLVKSQGFSYADETIDKMLDFLCERRERDRMVKTDEIEPFQLQLLCQHIEEKVIEKSGKKNQGNGYVVQPGDLGGKAGMKKVLQKFYEDRIKGLDSRWEKIKVRKLCEKGLIEKQFRMSLEQRHIMNKYKVSRVLLTHLVNSRLLRSEPRVGSIYYELSHDTLVQPILKSSQERKNKRARVYVPIMLIILVIASFFVVNQINKYTKIRDLRDRYEKAVKLREEGEYEEALKEYTSILENEKNRVTPYIERGKLYQELTKYDKAIIDYKKAIEINDKLPETHKGLAISYVYKRKPDKAIDVFHEAVDKNPDFASIYKAIAQVMKSKYMKKDLKALLEIASGVRLEDAAYYKYLAYDFSYLKEYDRAIEFYNKALELEGDEKKESTYRKLAISYVYRGNPTKAIDVFQEAVKVNPEFASVYKAIAKVMRLKYMDKDLKELLEIASESEYSSASFYEDIARDFNSLKEYDRAIEFYNKALGIDNKNVDAYKGLAVVYVKQKKIEKAIEIYRQAVSVEQEENANVDFDQIYIDIARAMKYEKIDNKDAGLEKLLGIAAKVKSEKSEYYEKLAGNYIYYLKNYDSAIAYYKKALELDNKKASAYKGLAVAYIKQKKIEKAIEVYQWGVNADVDFASIYVYIARTMKYEKIDNKDAALEKLLQMASNVESKDAKYYEGLGYTFFDLQNYVKAAELYKKAIDIGPSSFDAYKRLGLALGRQGQFDKAIENYEKALELKPTDINTNSNLAEALLINGNFSKAESLANELLQNKKLSTGYNLAMQLILTSSLVFQEKKSEALEQIKKIKQYTSSSRYRYYSSSWSYKLVKDFITENKKLKADDKELLLDLIKEIETSGRRSYKSKR